MLCLDKLPNTREGEKTVLFLHRHWVEVVTIFLYFIILIGMPLLLLFGLSFTDIQPFSDPLLAPFVLIGLFIYLLFVLVILFTQFTDYYLDTWIVTTERIINIEQHGLFSRHVAELHLNEVQDVTSETVGFLKTFLSYGDVYIQTAATRERFNFKNIDNPDEVKEIIVNLVQNDKIRHPVDTQVPPIPSASTHV